MGTENKVLEIPDTLFLILDWMNELSNIGSCLSVNWHWYNVMKNILRRDSNRVKRFIVLTPFDKIPPKRRPVIDILHRKSKVRDFPLLPSGAIYGSCIGKWETFVFVEGKLQKHIKYHRHPARSNERCCKVSMYAEFTERGWGIRTYLYNGDQAWTMTPKHFVQYRNDEGKKQHLYEKGELARKRLRDFLGDTYFRNKIMLYYDTLCLTK